MFQRNVLTLPSWQKTSRKKKKSARSKQRNCTFLEDGVCARILLQNISKIVLVTVTTVRTSNPTFLSVCTFFWFFKLQKCIWREQNVELVYRMMWEGSGTFTWMEWEHEYPVRTCIPWQGSNMASLKWGFHENIHFNSERSNPSYSWLEFSTA